jgi:hypothetical protein
MTTTYREVNEFPRCAGSGKLLTTGGITAERCGHVLIFENEKALAVFDTYLLPKYGDEAVWPESIVG